MMALKGTEGKLKSLLPGFSGKAKFDWVQIKMLGIDPRLQRTLSPAWVNKRVPDFALHKMGVIVVSRRADGHLFILDGQHRVELARTAGYTGRLYAQVFEGLTPSEEAALFNALNDKRSVSPFEHFRISVEAKAPIETEIARIVYAHGLSIGQNSAPGVVRAVSKLRHIYVGAGYADPTRGPEVLDRTLGLIVDAWAKQEGSFDGDVMYGIALVQARYNGELDRKSLVHKLTSIRGGPLGLLGSAKALTNMTGRQLPRCVAELVVELYNRKRRTQKLPDWNAPVEDF